MEGDLHVEAVLLVVQTEAPHLHQLQVQQPAPQVQLPLQVVRVPGTVEQTHPQAPLQTLGLQPETPRLWVGVVVCDE